MALNVMCKNGHTYMSADIYKMVDGSSWPADMPHCPICLENWRRGNRALEKRAQMPKGKKKNNRKRPGRRRQYSSVGFDSLS